ncbi:hypothetical protein Nepgr_017134 [Nepenthes gracilis]|uniref:Large ribosomal subunit protein bL32m n=1 Tax=Nepenthes gracilis TaxID=150966 RepID=A0AAD3SPV9_NEPGR|nr:hypothetical protein Nepgr_017134 [Nepenthes gracilis]
MAAIRSGTRTNIGLMLGLRRSIHGLALPAPISGAMDPMTSPPLTVPESGVSSDENIRFQLPSFAFGGSMELMAVPKKKVSPHKRGIRNGPKALKPTPVIIRCKSCGRVKLPHFYCCSGRKNDTDEKTESSN